MSAVFLLRNFVPLTRQTFFRALLAETGSFFVRAQRSFRRYDGVNNYRLFGESLDAVKLFLSFDVPRRRLIEHINLKFARFIELKVLM